MIPELRVNQKILALTFSNKAKANLGARLLSALGAQRFRRYVSLRNFHGHSAEILRAHGRTIGLKSTTAMPTRRTLERAIRPFLEGLDVAAAGDRKKEIETVLREAKQHCLSDEEVRALLAAAGNEYALEIENARVAKGELHYDDLLRHAQCLLHISGVANLYQHHYGVILIDEFQDLSLQQLDITIETCVTNRIYAGDPLQGIYTWAGANPVQVEQKLREICGEPHELNVSYRSSPAVLATVSVAATQMGGYDLYAANGSYWPDGGVSAAVTFPTGSSEGSWIAEMAAQILVRDSTATIGVIARAAWRRKPIDLSFATSSIPFTRWDLAIENPEIIKKLKDAARRLGGSVAINELEEVVLESIDGADIETYDDMVEALADLREIVDEVGTVSAAFQQLKLSDGNNAINPGVHILNAHVSKGQQFDWVFVPGFEGFHIPSGLASTAEEKLEEQRVLFVMLSRARHGLILSRATELISKKSKPYNTSESIWWPGIVSSCTVDRSAFESHVSQYVRTAHENI